MVATLSAPSASKSTRSAQHRSKNSKRGPRTPRGAECEREKSRAQRLLDLKIEFVGDSFAEPEAASRIVDLVPQSAGQDSNPAEIAKPPGASSYFASLYTTPLLSRDDEASLFRRLNFVKHRAAELRDTLDPSQPDVPLMDDIELLLAEADRVRNHIWRANLRLVVSVAKRYVNAENSFQDLVSDGNVSLLRAIECFDVSRGFRFSTYATWALRKNYHRAITRRHRDRMRFVTVDEGLLAEAPAQPATISPRNADAIRQALGRLLDRLPDRERLVVSARFGFDAGEHPQTLQQIAVRLGVCKERSRQLLLRALARLQTLAVEYGLEPLEM